MSFQHHFQPATDPGETRTLLLLHGTGGSERDLVDLGMNLLPGAAIISPKGKVNEHGMSRWFRRFDEGVFDEDDIRAQAQDLANFLESEFSDHKSIVALGYSNGANMGSALMTLHPDTLRGLIMWRGMRLFKEPVVSDLKHKKILMTNGTLDPMGPIHSAKEQAEIFRRGGADVTLHELPTGHSLTQSDFIVTQEWLKSSFD